MSSLSKRINNARTHAGLTQEALAERLQVTRAACSHWEQGISRPSDKNLEKLSIILEVNHEWLSVGRGEMYASAAKTAQMSGNKSGDLKAAEVRGDYNPASQRIDSETVQFSKIFFALPKTERKVIIDLLNLLAPKTPKKRKPK